MTDGSSQNAILRVENLDLSYGEHKVLSGVSFEVQAGSCLVVMGGSGCGKSTLLKSLVGLLEPAGGEVFARAIFGLQVRRKRQRFFVVLEFFFRGVLFGVR